MSTRWMRKMTWCLTHPFHTPFLPCNRFKSWLFQLKSTNNATVTCTWMEGSYIKTIGKHFLTNPWNKIKFRLYDYTMPASLRGISHHISWQWTAGYHGSVCIVVYPSIVCKNDLKSTSWVLNFIAWCLTSFRICTSMVWLPLPSQPAISCMKLPW